MTRVQLGSANIAVSNSDQNKKIYICFSLRLPSIL